MQRQIINVQSGETEEGKKITFSEFVPLTMRKSVPKPSGALTGLLEVVDREFSKLEGRCELLKTPMFDVVMATASFNPGSDDPSVELTYTFTFMIGDIPMGAPIYKEAYLDEASMSAEDIDKTKGTVSELFRHLYKEHKKAEAMCKLYLPETFSYLDNCGVFFPWWVTGLNTNYMGDQSVHENSSYPHKEFGANLRIVTILQQKKKDDAVASVGESSEDDEPQFLPQEKQNLDAANPQV